MANYKQEKRILICQPTLQSSRTPCSPGCRWRVLRYFIWFFIINWAKYINSFLTAWLENEDYLRYKWGCSNSPTAWVYPDVVNHDQEPRLFFDVGLGLSSLSCSCSLSTLLISSLTSRSSFCMVKTLPGWSSTLSKTNKQFTRSSKLMTWETLVRVQEDRISNKVS